MTPADLLAYLREHPLVRRVAWLGFISLIGAVTLTGYTFGLTDGFWGRAFSATLVFWILALGTVFGIRPLLIWLTRRLSSAPSRPPKASRGRKASPSRTTDHRAPANRWR